MYKMSVIRIIGILLLFWCYYGLLTGEISLLTFIIIPLAVFLVF